MAKKKKTRLKKTRRERKRPLLPDCYEDDYHIYEYVSTHNKLETAKEAAKERYYDHAMVKTFKIGKRYGVYVNYEEAPRIVPRPGRIKDVTEKGKYYIEGDAIKKRGTKIK